MEQIKDRIKRLLTEKKLTSAGFADIIGVQRSGISHILSGRNKPGLDVLNKILVSFPDISGDWLITGRGEMYKNTGHESKTENELFPVTGKENEEEEVLDMNKEEDPPVYGRRHSNTAGVNKKEVTATADINRGHDKKIEKIVVFYTDHTFSEYLPE
jgi:transcriptional regulator with XRE-family HTH domain